MKADSIHLFDFLGSGKTIFEIPVFQRNYEWDKDQCKQLFKDLTVAARTDTDHFIGAIVYVTETGNKMSHIYQIIDGQQRLTSLTLLLKALAYTDEQDRDEIEEEYLTNKYLNDNNHLKLKPVEHDYEAFESVMNGMTDYDKASKVIDNYKFFCKLINDSDIDSSKLYEAINHFNMVYIELSSDSNEENPQVIFESLNSTGVSLSSSDLVRNFLLMKLDSQEQAELYKNYWGKIERMFATKTFTEFIRHYLVVKTHVSVKRNSVYNSYKDYFISQGLNSENALVDLLKFANYYDQILNHKTRNAEFNRILDHINVMDSKVVFPYLMLLMDLENSGEIDQIQANELSHILESYLFRLKVCQLPTNGLNKIVVGLCDLSKVNGNLKLRLLRLLKANFPDDRKLYDSLMKVDLYHQRNHLAKLALVVLEEHRTKETINFDDAQVEHIMPQRLNAEWRQVDNADKVKEQLGGTLGNLTITKYNQEMSNKPYDEKREYYHNSNVSLTRELAKTYGNWGKDAITDRTGKLTAELIKIFPMPNIKEVSEDDITGEYTIDQPIDVTGKKPVQISISGNEYPVKTWRQMLVTFLNDIWNKDSLNFDRIKKNGRIAKMLFRSNRNPEKLENGTKIETNFSANGILTIIAKISEICDITDQVSFTVK